MELGHIELGNDRYVEAVAEKFDFACAAEPLCIERSPLSYSLGNPKRNAGRAVPLHKPANLDDSGRNPLLSGGEAHFGRRGGCCGSAGLEGWYGSGRCSGRVWPLRRDTFLLPGP